MKVSVCEKCQHCKRYVWSHSYLPSNYHAIGMSHAYHKCELENKRCLDMKRCPKWEEKSKDEAMFDIAAKRLEGKI